jgi:DNA polymerase/3'-5' exonuclease PolX
MDLKHDEAMVIAQRFMSFLSDLCIEIDGKRMIEIVGSLKRGSHMVGDVELLMILDPTRPRAQFGDRKVYPTRLDQRLATDLNIPYKLQEAIKKANGPALKRFALTDYSRPMDDFCIELFIVKPETWGIQNVIRTGPKEFSKRYVTNKRAGGLLPNNLSYISGMTRIRDDSTMNLLDLPTEEAAIKVLSRGWIPPEERWKLTERNSI